jgi:imidazolonepropionase-like amidohydrolase
MMLLKLTIACLGALLSTSASAEVHLLRVGRLIANASQATLGPSTIVVRDGKIVRVDAGHASAAGLELRADEPVREIDLRAFTALPGLIDAHVHFENRYGTPWWRDAVITDEYAVAIALHNARRTLRAGVTTVRDLGSRPQVMFAVRDAIRDGLAEGPRVLASGPAISIPGGHGDINGFRPDVNAALSERTNNTCTGADQCAERVRQASKAGADVIKVTVTGGVLSLQARGFDQHFTDAELRAIVETAKLLGLKTAAHAHGARGVEAAARAGFDSVEHAAFGDETAMKAMKERGTWFVPTLSTSRAYRERLGTGFYAPQVEIKAQQRLAETGKSVLLARKVGVRLAFGTDSGVYDHGFNGGELQLLVQLGGLTPREALVSATLGSAELLGIASETGSIESGKSADIIAVAGDPSLDSAAILKLNFVMARGHIALQP